VASTTPSAGTSQQKTTPQPPQNELINVSVAPSATAVSKTPHLTGLVPGTRLHEGYVSQLGHAIYAWGWPMVNVHNRKLIMNQIPEPGYMGGIVPMAPVNQLCMLHDYVAPEERMVACPNWVR